MSKQRNRNETAQADDVGVGWPVTLKPRDPDPEAMFFQDAPFPSNSVEIINWLGDAFYAMTTGKPVSIQGLKIDINPDPSLDSVLDNMALIIDNSAVGGKLVVATPGVWIVHSESKGYIALTQEQMDEKWVVSQ